RRRRPRADDHLDADTSCVDHFRQWRSFRLALLLTGRLSTSREQHFQTPAFRVAVAVAVGTRHPGGRKGPHHCHTPRSGPSALFLHGGPKAHQVVPQETSPPLLHPPSLDGRQLAPTVEDFPASRAKGTFAAHRSRVIVVGSDPRPSRPVEGALEAPAVTAAANPTVAWAANANNELRIAAVACVAIPGGGAHQNGTPPAKSKGRAPERSPPFGRQGAHTGERPPQRSTCCGSGEKRLVFITEVGEGFMYYLSMGHVLTWHRYRCNRGRHQREDMGCRYGKV
ncbi:MAG: hypothetical protein BJ554DRAFT_2806, partial [Olpidium bornovanus]